MILPKKNINNLFIIACSILLTQCNAIKAASASSSQPPMSPDAWRKYIFTHIYRTNVWKSEETASGPGSTLQSTATLRLFLPVIIETLGVKSMLDAGCGDINWIKETPLNLDYYVGVDIVPELIEKNSELYASNWCTFKELDIVKDQLPCTDFILCRDVMQHLSFKDIEQALSNFKKTKATYLCISTYECFKENKNDTRTGNCRFINFKCAPYNFPEPIIAFEEISAEKSVQIISKKICVWRLKDITLTPSKEIYA